MAINLIELNKEYEELSQEIDALAFALDRVLNKSYSIEQILNHHTMEATGENADVDL